MKDFNNPQPPNAGEDTDKPDNWNRVVRSGLPPLYIRGEDKLL